MAAARSRPKAASSRSASHGPDTPPAAPSSRPPSASPSRSWAWPTSSPSLPSSRLPPTSPRHGVGEDRLTSDVSHPASLRSFRPLHVVLLVLTFVTGMVDAVTYLELGHVFAANMTGNVILLGFALVGAGQISATASVVSLAAFMAGAAVSARLSGALQPARHHWLLT